MSKETFNSPIIITIPGRTRLFRNNTNQRKRELTTQPRNKIIRKKSLCGKCCISCGCYNFCSYCKIPQKRFFLPLLSLLYFVFVENTQHYVFFPLIITATAFIVFYNLRKDTSYTNDL